MMATHKVKIKKHTDVMIAKVCKKSFARDTTISFKVSFIFGFQTGYLHFEKKPLTYCTLAMMAIHKVKTKKHADAIIFKDCKQAFARGTTHSFRSFNEQ